MLLSNVYKILGFFPNYIVQMSFAQCITSTYFERLLLCNSQVGGQQDGGWGKKVFHTLISGSWPPEEPEGTLVYGTQWNTSQSPEKIGWCHYSLWCLKSHGNQVQAQETGKREILYSSLKRVEWRTLRTTNLSVSPLCLGRSWKRSSWMLS